MTIEVVLESEDLTSLIVECLDPTSIVALGRVSRNVRTALRAAIRGAPNLLVRAACNAGTLTKTQLIGWFALTSLEADAMPRSQYGLCEARFFTSCTAPLRLIERSTTASSRPRRGRPGPCVPGGRGSAAATSQGELVKMGRKRGYEWHTPPRYRCFARYR